MKKIVVFLVTMMFLVSSISCYAVNAAAPDTVLKSVTITGEITKINPGVPYNKEMLALKTSDNTYILNGKISGMKKHVGCSAKVTGLVTTGPQGILMFNVNSYKIVGKPAPSLTPTLELTLIPTIVPTLTPTPSVSYITLKGYLYNLNSDMLKFYIKTDKEVLELIGNTKGMENVVGNTVEVCGNYVYTLVATEYPIFDVISYKVIETPTPNMKLITISDNGGYAYLNKGDEFKLTLESNATTGYQWNYVQKPDEKVLLQIGYEYITDQNPTNMVGVGGNEVWTYKAIEDGETAIELMYSRPWESVAPAKTFVIKVIVGQSPTPTQACEVLQGTLIVNKIESQSNAELAYPYSFELKTNDSIYSLIGNTSGLEKYADLQVEVRGSHVETFVATEHPLFNVVSYTLIYTPSPTIVPTQIASSSTHTIISKKALFLSEPSVGDIGNPEDISGCTTISWTENSTKAFFNSKITVLCKNSKIDYEIELVEAISSDSESIKGIFNIKKDGELILKNASGELYGLKLPVDEYFKFYSDEAKFNLAAYITDRLDF